jgi:hypothetical protein
MRKAALEEVFQTLGHSEMSAVLSVYRLRSAPAKSALPAEVN